VTDLQDEICDRLVGSKIGPYWVGGPLHVAALVIDPSFVPSSRGDNRPGQFARAVGWPVVFCEAVVGANAVVGSEADRRSLAISLFAQVPPFNPAQPVRPMPGSVSRPAAAWAVVRAHESACGTDCPLHKALVAALAAVEAGGKWRSPFARGTDCQTAKRKRNARVTPKSPAAHHAVVAVRYLDEMMVDQDKTHSLANSFREAAKAETKVRGLDGAVKFCLDLAEKLKLTGAERWENSSG
jgi:hypothetical protein